MREHRFWFIDDDHRVRWAVRVSAGTEAEPRIVFTSRDRQVCTGFELEKEHNLVTRYELLELLGRAKIEALAQKRPQVAAAA